MPYGLFGKVPQKRDFMSVQMPSAVLSPFETWLQAAVAASRNELGQLWQDHYLVAPIWRFWIGEQILGTTVAGALMPSVDQVGRYFPLSIMYFADPGDDLPPPLLAPRDDWYGAIERRLLGALSEETDAYLASVLAGLMPPHEDAVPPAPPAPAAAGAADGAADETADEGASPATAAPEAGGLGPEPDVPSGEAVADDAADGRRAMEVVEALPDTSPFEESREERGAKDAGPVAVDFKGGRTLEVPPGQTLGEAADLLRAADYRSATGGRSYFWCAASRMGPARIHSRQGLPDPYFFSRMILWERGPR